MHPWVMILRWSPIGWTQMQPRKQRPQRRHRHSGRRELLPRRAQPLFLFVLSVGVALSAVASESARARCPPVAL